MADPEVTPETPAAEPEPVAAAVETPAPVAETPTYATRDEFQQLQRALYEVAARVQPPPAQPVTSPAEIKDEELWGMAQQGNRQAFEMYMERIAERKTNTGLGRMKREGLVLAQLAELYKKYPELGNPQHQLTQRAAAFKNVLIQMGSNPNDKSTDLDAILRAVADSRELFAPRTTGPVRVPPSGQMPAQHRQDPAAPAASAVSQGERDLAAKMGVKDPGKARERFWERNANGKSRVSPNIAAALNMEGQGGA